MTFSIYSVGNALNARRLATRAAPAWNALERRGACRTHRSPQSRVRAVVAAVDDRGVEASQELEVAAARPWLHYIEPILDAELVDERGMEIDNRNAE